MTIMLRGMFMGCLKPLGTMIEGGPLSQKLLSARLGATVS